MSSRRGSKPFRPTRPPELARDAHKGDAGRVLCIVGSRLYPGAAVLVARSCQRGGAGLVTIGALEECLLGVVPIAAPEAVYWDLSGPADLDPRTFGARLLRRKDHVIVAGCGLSTSDRAARAIDTLLAARLEAPLVLDADGLNLLGREPEKLRARRGALVITPHPGEAERLLGRAIGRDEATRREAARELAAKSGAIVCLKGHRTIVASDSQLFVNDTGNPGMATAGSGDVLAGLVGAYLVATVGGHKRTWTPFEAAATAVHVHGLAGDLAAKELGERGLVASDLIERLPAAQLRLRK